MSQLFQSIVKSINLVDQLCITSPETLMAQEYNLLNVSNGSLGQEEINWLNSENLKKEKRF